MTVLTFIYSTKKLEPNKPQLLNGLQLLNTEKNISKYFENDSISNFFEYLYSFTQANYGDESVTGIIDFLMDNKIHSHMIRLDEYFSLICDKLIPENAQTPQDQRKSKIFIRQQNVSNFLLAYSVNYCDQYFEDGGLKNMLNIIKNETFYEHFKVTDTYQRILVNLTCLPTSSKKSVWAELNAIDILLKIAEKDKTFKRSVYDVVLKIAKDDQINSIGDMPEIVSIFIRSIQAAIDKIQDTSGSCIRQKIEYTEELEENVYKSRLFDVYCVPDEYDENIKFPVTGALHTLYLLSVNDKIKYDLYVKYNLKDPLRVIILKGSEIEKKFALELLAQLCFDDLILQIVQRDTELVTYIETISKNSMHSITKLSKQILFSLSHKNTPKQVTMNTSKKSQIMISYNSETRGLCIKIKQELEKAGYKIWIDIDEIHGSSLDSMANAVETSEVVLICVTENYRQSVNCQAEAQYAFKLKKPIVPLIMQKGYESVGGWLGMIMGDKIYINFIKFTLDEAINRLLSQLTLLIINDHQPALDVPKAQPISNTPTQPVSNASTPVPVVQNPKNWTEADVVKWFKKDGVLAIYEYIKPCNGELLHQLYKMKIEAPQFFYQFITEGARSAKKQLGGRDILVFTKNLEELFK